jgi:predicted kinase
MSKLVLLNGPPGVGKSTLARRYADEHPMSLALEIDTVRGMLGSWLAESERSGPAAREIAAAMAAAHLRAGYDVVVPQLLTRRSFVERLASTAKQVGACFCEITLIDERAAVLDRARRRAAPDDGFSARALMEKQGNTPESAYDLFVQTLAERPDATIIQAGSLDAAYAELLDRITG